MNLNPIAPNQTEVTADGCTVLFSYRTPVAANVGGKFYVTDCSWSQTTFRHINRFLNGADAEEKPQSWFDSLLSCKINLK